jgi:hypothetical protein
MTEEAALRTLLEACDLVAARAAVRTLTARGYRWAPLGAKEGNYGLVNIGSDPGIGVRRTQTAFYAFLLHEAKDQEAGFDAALLELG